MKEEQLHPHEEGQWYAANGFDTGGSFRMPHDGAKWKVRAMEVCIRLDALLFSGAIPEVHGGVIGLEMKMKMVHRWALLQYCKYWTWMMDD